jgi:hypothetical protein
MFWQILRPAPENSADVWVTKEIPEKNTTSIDVIRKQRQACAGIDPTTHLGQVRRLPQMNTERTSKLNLANKPSTAAMCVTSSVFENKFDWGCYLFGPLPRCRN